MKDGCFLISSLEKRIAIQRQQTKQCCYDATFDWIKHYRCFFIVFTASERNWSVRQVRWRRRRSILLKQKILVHWIDSGSQKESKNRDNFVFLCEFQKTNKQTNTTAASICSILFFSPSRKVEMKECKTTNASDKWYLLWWSMNKFHCRC